MTGVTSEAAFSALQKEKEARFLDLTSDTVAERLDAQIRGATVLISGVTPGSLGADAARVIAAHGPKLLILANRSEKSLETTTATIKEANPGANVKPLVMDLASQQSVRSAAAVVLSLTSVVDVLINSAAVMLVPEFTTTPEGIEMHFGTNHIGHFLFTNLIMPALLVSPAPRVVNISAASHRSSPIRFDDYNFASGKEYEPFLGYAQSKCANLLFTVSLAQKLGKKGLVAIGVDPGGSITNLFYRAQRSILIKHGWADENGEPTEALKATVKTVPQATANYIMAGYDPTLRDNNGGVITVCEIDHSIPDHAKDPVLAEKLWKLSEKIVGQEFSYE
ncbi:hypothetical protein S7711_10262 [Stachybotrys chartarum IBT 7711]|uniref:NAD(P)-binding protein n=1 Tax=Stachybotrys chartarum (strain CBS 109288 / IBT 7711) TaxID=1280523 RepID=A0A084AF47_STACB|nr:hypothetical protein S7711_10262 [Stachybotrys chartarum IBT 7711]